VIDFQHLGLAFRFSQAYSVKVISYQHITKMMTTILVVLMASAALVGFIPQMRKHAEYERRLEEIRTEAEVEQALLQDYRVKQKRFQDDPDYVKKVAHEIGMVAPNEVIFRFYEEPLSRR